MCFTIGPGDSPSKMHIYGAASHGFTLTLVALTSGCYTLSKGNLCVLSKTAYWLFTANQVTISLSTTWGPGGWDGLSQEPGMQGRGMGDQSSGHPCLPPSLSLPPLPPIIFAAIHLLRLMLKLFFLGRPTLGWKSSH